MADEYAYALVVELGETEVPKLKNKLVKYFQSKKSNGGDCEVDYRQGERTAVLRFRRQEDQRKVLEKETHQISLDKGVLDLTVRLNTQEPAVTEKETPSAKDNKSDAAATKQEPTTDKVQTAAEGQAEAEAGGSHDDVEDDDLCCTSAVMGNVPKNISLEFLEMLVENIIKNSDSPSSPESFILQIIHDISSAVVTFQSEQDNTTFLKRCHKNKTFQNKGFSVRPLEATEQIVIEDIQNVSEEILCLHFENKGLDVETVEVDEDGESAVITFKSPKGVKKITEQKHKIKGKEFRVYPFYQSLGVVLYGKDKPLLKLPAAISETIDSAVWKYLTDNPSAAQTIHSDLAKHFCDVNLSQPVVCLSPASSLLQCKDAKAVIKKWTNTVKSAFAKAISQFKSLQFNLDSQILEECEMEIAQMSENVAVVPDRAKGVLSVVGLVKDVDRLQKPLSVLIGNVEKRVHREKSSVTQEIKMSPSTFHILSQDGFQERLQQQFPELHVSYEKEKAMLKIRGINNEIIVGYRVIIDIVMSMKRQYLELDGSLLDLLKGEKEEELTEAFLISNGMNVAFEISAHRVQLLGVSEKDLQDAHDYLAQLLKSQYIDVEDQEVLKKPEWQQLVSQLEEANSKPCRTQIRLTGTQVVVSGHKHNVNKVSMELEDFILENTQVEDAIVVKPQVILEYIRSLNTSWLLDFKDRVLVSYRQEEICLSGSRANVTQCKDLFDDIVTSVYFDTLKISKPGVKKFFQEKKDVYIPLAKSQTGCLVHLVDDTSGTRNNASLFPQPAYQLQTLDGVDIVVCKADMCSYPVRAVVNSSNQDLKHNGGLAGALLNAAGPQLQDECDKYIKSKGPLKPGDCMITAAGGQLYCKNIIHVVAPKFDPTKRNKCVAQLKRAVKESLDLAENNNYDSLALPIISRGHGFPLDLCAGTIVKVVREHCDEKCDDGALKKIHFVNNDDAAVQAMEAAVRQEFGNHGVTSSQKIPTSSTRPIGKNVASAPCLGHAQTKEGLDITLMKGFIEAATTEVTVNVVFENLALNKGAISNAILLVAGPKLQQQILAKAPSGNFGDIIVTDGCKLKSSQVFHAVMPHWDKDKGGSEKILKGIFRDCLTKADSAGLTSISFPAMGTGNLGFPKDRVMSWMLDECVAFSSSNPKHLKKVVIVVFPGDVKTIQAFSDEFVKKFPNASNTSAGSSQGSGGPFSKVVSQSGQHETTMGSVTIQIVTGDITKETSDIIVNSSNDNFTLKSGVSKAILDAAGPAVETECQNLGALPNQNMIITQPGNLKCNKILHLVGHTDPTVINSRMKEALNMCISKSYTSVSFPAIGTGQGGVGAKPVADAMLDAVIDVLGKNSSSTLTTIRIVIFQQPMVNDFLSSMQERTVGDSNPKNIGFWGNVGLKLKALFTSDNTSKPQKDEDFVIDPVQVDPACFHICGDSQMDIDSAKQWITDLVIKEQTSTNITDNNILSFSNADHQRIHDIQVRMSVSIKTVSKNAQASIIIEGLSKDVLEASNEIHKMLTNVRDEEELKRKIDVASTVAEWQYKKQGHTFKSFDQMNNFKLEEALEQKQGTVIIKFSGQDYTVTMPNGPAKNSQGGTMEIKRIDKLKDEEVPEHWDTMPANTTSYAVTIPAGNAEYNEVLQLFHATCPRTVVKIERIQNPELWKSLQVKKRHMEGRKLLQNNERRLFHGTCEDIIPTINQHGFNRSYAGKNAACYGNGTYFAVNASYSAQDTYSRPNKNQEKHMYLCRVLTGEFDVGKQGMIAPPNKGTGSVEMYDSVVDRLQNPSMFVIFHDTQAYPEYLITFK